MTQNSKPWYKSKTVWINILTMIVALLTVPEIGSVVPESAMPYILLITAYANIFLRFITDQPIKKA